MVNKRDTWFGTRGNMRWVKSPAPEGDFSPVGWGVEFQYLNGGAGVRTSVGSHKTYTMDWNSVTRDEARAITDYADGVYDTSTGINLIYFLDRMAMDKNVLPQAWAAPYQSLADGTTLVSNQFPVAVTTPTNSFRYPARSVQYTANGSSKSVWIPIPEGYTAWLGVHGSASGDAGVVVTPTSGISNLTPVEATMLSVTTNTRVVDSFDSTTCDGISLSFNNVSPTSTDVLIISGMIVQILPTGTPPQTGDFISGQGNSGCQFSGKPVQMPRSSVFDSVSLSAVLVETGSWI